MKVFVVNGYPASGKTTFEKMVVEELSPVYTHIISTVDFVKEIAIQCGWDGTKTPENRKFLSDLKYLLSEWNDVPFKKIKEFIQKQQEMLRIYELTECGELTFFIDSREPQEIKRFCEELGATSVLIERPGQELQLSNSSDAGVMNYQYDEIIVNDGDLEALHRKVLKFIKQYKLK